MDLRQRRQPKKLNGGFRGGRTPARVFGEIKSYNVGYQIPVGKQSSLLVFAQHGSASGGSFPVSRFAYIAPTESLENIFTALNDV